MIVPKILIHGRFQPDLSQFDKTKYTLKGYSLNEDNENYTLNVEEILDKKKLAYRTEVSDYVEQYARKAAIGETEGLAELSEKIRQITNDIRARYDI